MFISSFDWLYLSLYLFQNISYYCLSDKADVAFHDGSQISKHLMLLFIQRNYAILYFNPRSRVGERPDSDRVSHKGGTLELSSQPQGLQDTK